MSGRRASTKGREPQKDAEETHTKVDANMRNMELVHASDPVVASHSVASLWGGERKRVREREREREGETETERENRECE